MGYDITAEDENGNEVAYLRAYMGAFRMCREQGYDWFYLIDAEECDCGCSGCGIMKEISLLLLEDALHILKSHDTKGRLPNGRDNRDEWTHRKPILKEFMEKCIEWCIDNNKRYINIYFG